MNNSYIYIYHVNVTQTVPDISPLMPMHQDPLLVCNVWQAAISKIRLPEVPMRFDWFKCRKCSRGRFKTFEIMKYKLSLIEMKYSYGRFKTFERMKYKLSFVYIMSEIIRTRIFHLPPSKPILAQFVPCSFKHWPSGDAVSLKCNFHIHVTDSNSCEIEFR